MNGVHYRSPAMVEAHAADLAPGIVMKKCQQAMTNPQRARSTGMGDNPVPRGGATLSASPSYAGSICNRNANASEPSRGGAGASLRECAHFRSLRLPLDEGEVRQVLPR
jgi:hypothetical protein